MKKKFIILMMVLVLTCVPMIGIKNVYAENEEIANNEDLIDNNEIIENENIPDNDYFAITEYDDYFSSDYSYNNNYDYDNYFESRDDNDYFNRFKEALQRENIGEAIAILVAAFAGIFIVLGLLLLGYAIYMLIVTIKIYKKAGKSGWTAIIPFYNMYVLSEFTWGKGWYAFIYIGITILNNNIDISALSGILDLAIGVLSIMTLYKLAKAFGKGAGFTCGLIFLNPIFMGILAFSSKVKYIGVNGSTNDFGNNNTTGANYQETNTVNNSTNVNANYTYNNQNNSNNQNQAHFCPYCGNSVDNNHTFCGNCGSKLK